jgi:hypothetical protein
MLDNNQQQVKVEKNNTQRFLDQGWTIIDQNKPAKAKYKLTIDAEAVTTTKSKGRKKKELEPIVDEGEDIILSEDINHVCDEDCSHDTTTEEK